MSSIKSQAQTYNGNDLVTFVPQKLHCRTKVFCLSKVVPEFEGAFTLAVTSKVESQRPNRALGELLCNLREVETVFVGCEAVAQDHCSFL
jgi:hypothetical protein